MKTIAARLSELPPNEMSRLQYAFEGGFSQYISIGDNEFIGVNTDFVKHLEVVDRVGAWTYGVDKSRKAGS
jgi:hypothetical protein